MLLVLLLTQAHSVFLHENLYCPSDFRGDGICDQGCMTKDSFLDTSKDNWNDKLIFQSDCISSCLKKNCTIDLLQNNVCDSLCNNWECGWDNQQCGFCADGCKSENLMNNVKDSVCESKYCFYDNDKSGWCALGCTYADMFSSVFNPLCNVTQCLYQNGLGLQKLYECSQGCTLNMLENSYCDPECNNEKCKWDNQKCLCSEGCSTEMMKGTQCKSDSPCLNANCEYLDWACPVCADKCLNSSLGNGICDEACNTINCDYDQGDCGCAPGCKSFFSNGVWTFLEGCSAACLVESCLFNYGSCKDSFMLDLAMTYALAKDTYNSPLSINYTVSCTLEMLKSFNSNNKCSSSSGCNTEDFLYCNGFTNYNIPNCFKTDDKDCLVESGNLYFRKENIDKSMAPPGQQGQFIAKSLYQNIATTVNELNLIMNATIYWLKEGSYSSKNPNLIQVPIQTGFYNALALTVSPFNIIMVKGGTYDFTTSNDKLLYAVSTDPLSKTSSIPQYELQIIGEENNRPTIQFLKNLTIGGNFKKLIIKNIIFTGKFLIDNNCRESLCNYCPKIIDVGTDMKMNDRNQMLSTKDLSSYGTYCGGNSSYVPFDFTNQASIFNVVFESFQSQTTNLIKASSSLTISNSVFTKVQPLDQNPLILIKCSSDQCFNVSLTIENTQVIDLNYGYEHIEDMTQGHFLTAENIGDVLLKDVQFQYCMSISCKECTFSSLLSFEGIGGEIMIQSCSFENIYVKNLIYVNAEELVYPSESYDVFGKRKQLSQIHLNILNSKFLNIYAQYGLILHSMMSLKQNILIQNSSFIRIATMENGIFSIQGGNEFTTAESEGEWFYFVKNNLRKLVFNPPRTCIINNVTIGDVSAGKELIQFVNYPNIRINLLTVMSVREAVSSDPYTFAIRNFLSAKKYLSSTPISSLVPITELVSIISINSVKFAIFESISIQNISSSSFSFSSIFSVNFKSNFTINGYKFSDTKVTSNLAAALSCDSVSNLIASNIEINQVRNGYLALILVEQTANITMSGFVLIESSSNFSSAIQINDANLVDLQNITAKSLWSFDSKGTVVGLQLDANPKSVVFNEFEVTSSGNLHGQGLVLYLDCLTSVSNFTMNLTNIKVTDSKSKDSLIYLASNLYFEQGTIENFKVYSSYINNGGLISDFHNLGVLTVKSFLSVNNHAFCCGVYGKYRNSGTLLEIFDSIVRDCECFSEVLLFEGNSQSTIYAENLTVSNTSSIVNTISLNKVKFNGSNIIENNIEKGIGFFVTMAELYLANSYFFLFSTKVIFSLESKFSCNFCTFEQITASIFSSYQQSSFEIANSTFQNCEITTNNMIYTTSTDTSVRSNFTNCIFHYNTFGQEMMLFENSLIQFENCQIKHNQMSDFPSVKITSSRLNISSTIFENQTNSYIFATLGSTIEVNYCIFSGLEKIILQFTDYHEKNSQLLEDNSISFLGGAIYVKESNLVVDSSSFFNVFSKSGAAIYSDNSDLELLNSSFLNCSTSTRNTSGVVYLNEGNLAVQSCNFSNSLTESSLIYAFHLEKIQIFSSEFKNNSNSIGGAIYAENEDSSIFILENSVFENNIASDEGGAIFIENFNLTVSNCLFTSNKALNKGGALLLDIKQCSDCKSAFSSPSTFINNSCPNCSGGAIHWSDTEPENLTKNNFLNNSARYGPDYASSPTKIKLKNSRRLTEIDDFRPGKTFTDSIFVCIYDDYDQIVNDTTYNSLTGKFKSNEGTVVSPSEMSLNNGCFNLTGFTIRGRPGVADVINFEVANLDQGQKMGKNNENSQSNYISVNFTVNFRNCSYGERKSETECTVCEKPKYLIETGEICKSCLTSAECLGGYLILPKPGYWKLNMYSSDLLACPVSSACLGSATLNINNTDDAINLDDSEIDFTGSCAQGYYGHLCASCEMGYSKSTNGNCTKCPSSEINSLIITSILICMLFVAYIMVTSTLKSAFSAKSLYSIYIKIFTNYLQIIFLTTQFNLNWPTYVMTFFNVQRTAASASDQLYSIDCFFSEKSSYSNEEVYYFKLLAAALLPPVIWVASFLIWLFVCFMKETYAYIKRELFTTMIVLFFLVHPNIVKTIFSSLSCREIKSIDFWLVDNLEIQCFTPSHYKTIVTLSLPCIVVWGFGVPTVVLIIMLKRYRDLGKDNNKVIFGFLYNGFKQGKFFWEFVILYRKILIICISVFMSQGSTTIQALTVVILLLIALYLQYSQNPYNCKQLNYMEIEALLTATLTIYCGLYYLSNTLNEAIKTFLFAAIIVGNCYFVVYWLYYMTKAVVDILVNFFPGLRIWLKKGDFIEGSLYEQKLSSKGVYFDLFDGEKKYTFMKNSSHGLRTKIDSAKSMTDLFKHCMIEKLKFEAFTEDDSEEVHLNK